MSIRAVVLDMDGTLIDTPAAIAELIGAVLDEFGRTDADMAAIRGTIGRPLDATFAKLLDEDPDTAVVEQAIARYRELFAERVLPNAARLLFPDVAATLEDWRASGLQLAVATSKIRRSAEPLLSGAGIIDQFHSVICHDMVSKGKPDPEMGLLAASELGVPPDECVLVGDAADDIRLGIAADMTTVGVTYGAADRSTLEAAGAHHIVDAFADVAHVIEGLRLDAAVSPPR